MSNVCCDTDEMTKDPARQKALRSVLWLALLINMGMFIVEFAGGILGNSNALLADSADMLSDTFVYGVSLWVLTGDHHTKAQVSLAKGVLMGILGLFVLGQAVYKILVPSLPEAGLIYVLGFVALIANIITALLLLRFRNDDRNVKSAWLCSRNDVLGNAAVIAGGFLVLYFGSMWPDIIIGVGIALIVLWSSIGIVRDSIPHIKHEH
ncbi:MAG: cation diffusion facilitator family transporter [Patescibacteria group bacterium]